MPEFDEADVWVPEQEFVRRYRNRSVVESSRGQTLFDRGGRALWTEFVDSDLPEARGHHPGAAMWTEHITGDGATFYSRGIGRVNRSGSFVLVEPRRRALGESSILLAGEDPHRIEDC